MKLNSVFLLIAVCLAMLPFNSLQSQNTFNKKYVKIIVNGVNSSLDEQTIDLFIRAQSGVVTSRMDHRTHLYFGIYETSSGLSLSDFKTWIISLGYTVKCSVEDEHGKGNDIKLKASDCDTLEKINN